MASAIAGPQRIAGVQQRNPVHIVSVSEQDGVRNRWAPATSWGSIAKSGSYCER